MNENYYTEIERFIKRNEINKKRRILEDNYDTLSNYWEIGRLLVDAQGGEKRAKYGNELIKKWSIIFSKYYGNNYNYTNLKRYRQFYLSFQNGATLWHQLSWSHIKTVIPIKDMNKRNYYLNLCIEKNLSVRELNSEIKSNSYERLLNKPKSIKLIVPKKEYSILDYMKNPIIIKVNKNEKIKNEKDLETTILSQITFILSQLGKGFCFIDSEYKIKNYYIDLLLFNIELNCYVVVELKLRKLKIEDKAQTQNYMKLVDERLKKSSQNKTIGIIISKEQDEYVANFIKSDNLIPIEYKLENN